MKCSLCVGGISKSHKHKATHNMLHSFSILHYWDIYKPVKRCVCCTGHSACLPRRWIEKYQIKLAINVGFIQFWYVVLSECKAKLVICVLCIFYWNMNINSQQSQDFQWNLNCNCMRTTCNKLLWFVTEKQLFTGSLILLLILIVWIFNYNICYMKRTPLIK